MKHTLSFILISILLCVFACNSEEPQNTNTTKKYYEKNDDTKRLLCYNVRHCEGMDSVINYDRITGIIAALTPDYVCLQELDSATERSNFANQLKVMGEKLGMYSYFGPAINYSRGKYGVGILSKKPALKTYNIGLPGKEKRTLLIAEFSDFLVMSTHLDLVEENRIESARIVSEKVRSLNKKAFLAGDLNESDRNASMFREFEKDWKIVSSTLNTFPTRSPNKCIDFILEKKTMNMYNITKTNVIYSLPNYDVSKASDHFPVFVDFK